MEEDESIQIQVQNNSKPQINIISPKKKKKWFEKDADEVDFIDAMEDPDFKVKDISEVIKNKKCLFTNEQKDLDDYYFCLCTEELYFPICRVCAFTCHNHHMNKIKVRGYFSCMCGEFNNHQISQEDEIRYNEKLNTKNACFYREFSSHTITKKISNNKAENNNSTKNNEGLEICPICIETGCLNKDKNEINKNNLENNNEIMEESKSNINENESNNDKENAPVKKDSPLKYPEYSNGNEITINNKFKCQCTFHPEINVVTFIQEMENMPIIKKNLLLFNFNVLLKSKTLKKIFIDFFNVKLISLKNIIKDYEDKYNAFDFQENKKNNPINKNKKSKKSDISRLNKNNKNKNKSEISKLNKNNKKKSILSSIIGHRKNKSGADNMESNNSIFSNIGKLFDSENDSQENAKTAQENKLNNLFEKQIQFFVDYVNISLFEIFYKFINTSSSQFMHIKNIFLDEITPNVLLKILSFSMMHYHSLIDSEKYEVYLKGKIYFATLVFEIFVKSHFLNFNNLINLKAILNMNIFQREIYLWDSKNFYKITQMDKDNLKGDNFKEKNEFNKYFKEFNNSSEEWNIFIANFARILLEILELAHLIDFNQLDMYKFFGLVVEPIAKIFKFLVKYNLIEEALKLRYFDLMEEIIDNVLWDFNNKTSNLNKFLLSLSKNNQFYGLSLNEIQKLMTKEQFEYFQNLLDDLNFLKKNVLFVYQLQKSIFYYILKKTDEVIFDKLRNEGKTSIKNNKFRDNFAFQNNDLEKICRIFISGMHLFSENHYNNHNMENENKKTLLKMDLYIKKIFEMFIGNNEFYLKSMHSLLHHYNKKIDNLFLQNLNMENNNYQNYIDYLNSPYMKKFVSNFKITSQRNMRIFINNKGKDIIKGLRESFNKKIAKNFLEINKEFGIANREYYFYEINFEEYVRKISFVFKKLKRYVERFFSDNFDNINDEDFLNEELNNENDKVNINTIVNANPHNNNLYSENNLINKNIGYLNKNLEEKDYKLLEKQNNNNWMKQKNSEIINSPSKSKKKNLNRNSNISLAKSKLKEEIIYSLNEDKFIEDKSNEGYMHILELQQKFQNDENGNFNEKELKERELSEVFNVKEIKEEEYFNDNFGNEIYDGEYLTKNNFFSTFKYYKRINELKSFIGLTDFLENLNEFIDIYSRTLKFKKEIMEKDVNPLGLKYIMKFIILITQDNYENISLIMALNPKKFIKTFYAFKEDLVDFVIKICRIVVKYDYFDNYYFIIEIMNDLLARINFDNKKIKWKNIQFFNGIIKSYKKLLFKFDLNNEEILSTFDLIKEKIKQIRNSELYLKFFKDTFDELPNLNKNNKINNLNHNCEEIDLHQNDNNNNIGLKEENNEVFKVQKKSNKKVVNLLESEEKEKMILNENIIYNENMENDVDLNNIDNKNANNKEEKDIEIKVKLKESILKNYYQLLSIIIEKDLNYFNYLEDQELFLFPQQFLMDKIREQNSFSLGFREEIEKFLHLNNLKSKLNMNNVEEYFSIFQNSKKFNNMNKRISLNSQVSGEIKYFEFSYHLLKDQLNYFHTNVHFCEYKSDKNHVKKILAYFEYAIINPLYKMFNLYISHKNNLKGENYFQIFELVKLFHFRLLETYKILIKNFSEDLEEEIDNNTENNPNARDSFILNSKKPKFKYFKNNNNKNTLKQSIRKKYFYSDLKITLSESDFQMLCANIEKLQNLQYFQIFELIDVFRTSLMIIQKKNIFNKLHLKQKNIKYKILRNSSMNCNEDNTISPIFKEYFEKIVNDSKKTILNKTENTFLNVIQDFKDQLAECFGVEFVLVQALEGGDENFINIKATVIDYLLNKLFDNLNDANKSKKKNVIFNKYSINTLYRDLNEELEKKEMEKENNKKENNNKDNNYKFLYRVFATKENFKLHNIYAMIFMRNLIFNTPISTQNTLMNMIVENDVIQEIETIRKKIGLKKELMEYYEKNNKQINENIYQEIKNINNPNQVQDIFEKNQEYIKEKENNNEEIKEISIENKIQKDKENKVRYFLIFLNKYFIFGPLFIELNKIYEFSGERRLINFEINFDILISNIFFMQNFCEGHQSQVLNMLYELRLFPKNHQKNKSNILDNLLNKKFVKSKANLIPSMKTSKQSFNKTKLSRKISVKDLNDFNNSYDSEDSDEKSDEKDNINKEINLANDFLRQKDGLYYSYVNFNLNILLEILTSYFYDFEKEFNFSFKNFRNNNNLLIVYNKTCDIFKEMIQDTDEINLYNFLKPEVEVLKSSKLTLNNLDDTDYLKEYPFLKLILKTKELKEDANKNYTIDIATFKKNNMTVLNSILKHDNISLFKLRSFEKALPVENLIEDTINYFNKIILRYNYGLFYEHPIFQNCLEIIDYRKINQKKLYNFYISDWNIYNDDYFTLCVEIYYSLTILGDKLHHKEALHYLTLGENDIIDLDDKFENDDTEKSTMLKKKDKIVELIKQSNYDNDLGLKINFHENKLKNCFPDLHIKEKEEKNNNKFNRKNTKNLKNESYFNFAKNIKNIDTQYFGVYDNESEFKRRNKFGIVVKELKNFASEKGMSNELGEPNKQNNIYLDEIEKSSTSNLFNIYFVKSFFNRIIQSLEIVVNNEDHSELKEIYFIKNPDCYLLQKGRVFSYFDIEPNRENAVSKVKNILDSIDYFEIYMKYKKTIKNKVQLFLLDFEYWYFDMINLILAIFINIFLIAYLTESALDAGQDDSLLYTIKYLIGMIQVCLNGALILLFMYSKYGLSFLITLNELIRKHLTSYRDIDFDKRLIINKLSLFQKIRLYILDSIIFNEDLKFVNLNLIISLIGITNLKASFLFSIQLLTAIKFFNTLGDIINAIKSRYDQLLAMVLFLIILVYFYSSFNFYILNEQYKEIGFGYEGEAGVSFPCENLVSCFIFHFNEGIRQGGEDIINFTSQNYKLYFARFFTDLIFFITVILLVLNMINGIVVSTFSALREESDKKIEDKLNKCFICSIDKSEFEKRNIKFESHIYEEHNYRDYINYFLSVKFKDLRDLDSMEWYVREMINQRNVYMFPIFRAKSLGGELMNNDEDDD